MFSSIGPLFTYLLGTLCSNLQFKEKHKENGRQPRKLKKKKRWSTGFLKLMKYETEYEKKFVLRGRCTEKPTFLKRNKKGFQIGQVGPYTIPTFFNCQGSKEDLSTSPWQAPHQCDRHSREIAVNKTRLCQPDNEQRTISNRPMVIIGMREMRARRRAMAFI